MHTSGVNAGPKNTLPRITKVHKHTLQWVDTIPPTEIMEVITAVITSTNSFSIETVANLYTPNAVVTDDEPPYSWNGPTAGVQWVNAVEKACKDNQLTKLKGEIEPINVYQLKDDNVYIIVPVRYTGNLPGRRRFAVKGAFTFVLRNINGKWMVKSQTWMQEKGISGL
jgi:ketosteroid isomerase-like protein